MYNDIKERISVIAIFKNGTVLPYSFRWQGRKYTVEQINLEHQEKKGESLLFCFAVSAGGNNYELSFSSSELTWILERAWQE